MRRSPTLRSHTRTRPPGRRTAPFGCFAASSTSTAAFDLFRDFHPSVHRSRACALLTMHSLVSVPARVHSQCAARASHNRSPLLPARRCLPRRVKPCYRQPIRSLQVAAPPLGSRSVLRGGRSSWLLPLLARSLPSGLSPRAVPRVRCSEERLPLGDRGPWSSACVAVPSHVSIGSLNRLCESYLCSLAWALRRLLLVCRLSLVAARFAALLLLCASSVFGEPAGPSPVCTRTSACFICARLKMGWLRFAPLGLPAGSPVRSPGRFFRAGRPLAQPSPAAQDRRGFAELGQTPRPGSPAEPMAPHRLQDGGGAFLWRLT